MPQLICPGCSSGGVAKQTQDSLDSFEKGMGIVLRNAWTHIEALQTTDIPLLVEYITGVRDGKRGGGHTADVGAGVIRRSRAVREVVSY